MAEGGGEEAPGCVPLFVTGVGELGGWGVRGGGGGGLLIIAIGATKPEIRPVLGGCSVLRGRGVKQWAGVQMGGDWSVSRQRGHK